MTAAAWSGMLTMMTGTSLLQIPLHGSFLCSKFKIGEKLATLDSVPKREMQESTSGKRKAMNCS